MFFSPLIQGEPDEARPHPSSVSKYDAFNAIYVEMMPKPLPARTFVGVAALPSGAQIEIEFVAARK